MKLYVLPGDGIGPEITAATLQVLEAARLGFGLPLDLVEDVVGHASLEVHGTTVRPGLVEAVRQADGLLLGPTATADFDAGRGEVNPSMLFRKSFDLYANIRPSRTYEGLRAPLGAFDLVTVRENTEGFYADRNMESGNGEILVTADVAISLRRITRLCCERIARAAFALAMTRRRHVTIVHKANVLKVTDGMFLNICRDIAAAEYPEVAIDDLIIDAMMAHVVRKPSRFDVIVTTNMYGDILSDLTAELSGSLGLGASLNYGDTCAMAQASHGSAPDIAGRGIANPFSLILSTGMLLSWHGARSGQPAFAAAGKAIDAAVEAAIAARETTRDLGGPLSTADAGRLLAQRLQAGTA